MDSTNLLKAPSDFFFKTKQIYIHSNIYKNTYKNYCLIKLEDIKINKKKSETIQSFNAAGN